MKAVVFCGVQASGKTTFHRERLLLTACLEAGLFGTQKRLQPPTLALAFWPIAATYARDRVAIDACADAGGSFDHVHARCDAAATHPYVRGSRVPPRVGNFPR